MINIIHKLNLISKTIALGKTNLINTVANTLYLKTGIDFTKPIYIYAQVNYYCNSGCKMCTASQGRRKDELPASVWIQTLKKMKLMFGNIKVNFSGGEVLLKDDAFDIFEFCHENNIIFGLTTNGLLLSKSNIERFINLNPFNLNISLDSLNSDIYQQIRGVSFVPQVIENLKYLKEYKDRIGSDTIINIKTIVCKNNLHELDKTVEYATNMGFAGVTFSPMIKVTAESCEMFNVDRKLLLNMVAKLIQMKRKGFKILNTDENMKQWIDYFNDNLVKDETHCLVPLRNLYILENGDIQLCDLVEERYGNINQDDIETILMSEEMNKLKKDLLHCRKNCIYCVKRSMKDYFLLAYKYITMPS